MAVMNTAVHPFPYGFIADKGILNTYTSLFIHTSCGKIRSNNTLNLPSATH